MPTLDDPVDIGSLTLPNRLYRAPLLECAGTGDGAVETLIADLEPGAAAGAGLLCQGATIVRGEGGCAAPEMTRVHDPAFVAELERLTDRIHEHGSHIFCQLEHGGLRSMETWHAGYRARHPELEQLAVSRPPWQLRLLDRLGFLEFSPHVLSTQEARELARDFATAGARAIDAGYDGVHVAGANMGIVQQFLSPFYNRRDDEFADGVRFLELLHDEFRERAGDAPLVAKVPVETPSPPVVRRRIDADDAVVVAERLAEIGYDALAPVETSVVWDMSIVRGEYPARAWGESSLQPAYHEAFGGRLRTEAVKVGNRVESLFYGFEPAWNADIARRIREAVDVPVMLEGGIRKRGRIDRLLGESCDLVGMARPFYAEPKLPARLLGGVPPGTGALCENCNNCTVPQVTDEPGRCRTPSVVRERARRERDGAYETGR
ncbi:NADH:flavin oxidoreductase [Haloarchaeobius sp. FL176]|uniref:oxidoreductase n=1 Tax=Haloarchaeobius sp. FL176 TaxID=2967129 RepID=UPI00214970D3|nr:NADH:flavin oxidoreductase [Haloarchaeobius sp. FL176]